MKRIAMRNIKEDMYIEKGHSNIVYGFSPRVYDAEGNCIGYVTEMDFLQMVKDGKLAKVMGDYWYARYALITK